MGSTLDANATAYLNSRLDNWKGIKTALIDLLTEVNHQALDLGFSLFSFSDGARIDRSM
jgi:hypothetical protein